MPPSGEEPRGRVPVGRRRERSCRAMRAVRVHQPRHGNSGDGRTGGGSLSLAGRRGGGDGGEDTGGRAPLRHRTRTRGNASRPRARTGCPAQRAGERSLLCLFLHVQTASASLAAVLLSPCPVILRYMPVRLAMLMLTFTGVRPIGHCNNP